MSNRWIIRARSEEPADQGVHLYWTNEDGWNPVVAEVFTDDEKDDYPLPLGGEWCITGGHAPPMMRLHDLDDRDDLVEHLRHAHGFRDYEPGGEGHEEDVMGFAMPLNEWSDEELDDWHLMDHADYPGGGGPDKHDPDAHMHDPAPTDNEE